MFDLTIDVQRNLIVDQGAGETKVPLRDFQSGDSSGRSWHFLVGSIDLMDAFRVYGEPLPAKPDDRFTSRAPETAPADCLLAYEFEEVPHARYGQLQPHPQ